jgi:WD40 repeat protein
MATGREVDFSAFVETACLNAVARRWLHKRIEDFVDDKTGPRILVILGDPGAGKSTALAQFVADRRCAHFFCGRSEGVAAEQGGGWNEAVRCAETLGSQLVRLHGKAIVDWSRFGIEVSVRAQQIDGDLTVVSIEQYDALPRPRAAPFVKVDATFASNRGNVTGVSIQELRLDPKAALQELFFAPLRNAAHRTEDVVPILVDALDEWDRSACADDIVVMLSKADLPANVKVVASARPEYLSRLPDNVITIDMSGDEFGDHIRSDIEGLFIAANDHRARPDKEIRRLAASADGNFLYAHYLLATPRDGPVSSDDGEPNPPGLDAFYAKEIKSLGFELEREGRRGDLAALLPVVCASRQPITAALIAGAASVPEDLTVDTLQRLRTFIRARKQGTTTLYAPFHRSLSDFVLRRDTNGERAGALAHRRLVDALLPDPIPGANVWGQVPDYGIRHLSAHAAACGADAKAALRALLDDTAYIEVRVRQIGIDALEEDVRYARAVGAEPPYLAGMLPELALRSAASELANISVAQQLAVAASAVGADDLATAFAEHASEPIRLIPRWSQGLEGTRLSVGGFRLDGRVSKAALSGQFLATCSGSDATLWDARNRLRIGAWELDTDIDAIVPLADGSGAWVATSNDAETSTLRKVLNGTLPQPDGIAIGQRISALEISPDGATVAIGTRQGRMVLVDAETGDVLSRRDIGGLIARLSIAGDLLLALSWRRKLVSWQYPAMTLHEVVPIPFDGAYLAFSDRTAGLAFDADTGEAFIGGEDGSLIRTGLETGGEFSTILSAPGWIDHVALLGRQDLIVGDSTGRIHLVSRTGAPTLSFRGFASKVVLVGELDDETGLAVSRDGEVGYWRRPNDPAVRPAPHAAAIADIVFSDDGESFASIDIDGGIVRWSIDGTANECGYLNPDAFSAIRIASDLDSIVIESEGIQRTALSKSPHSFLSASRWPVAVPDKCATTFHRDYRSFAIDGEQMVAAVNYDDGVELWTLQPQQCRAKFAGESVSHFGLSPNGEILVTRSEYGFKMRRLEESLISVDLPPADGILGAPFLRYGAWKCLFFIDRMVGIMDLDACAVENRWDWPMDIPSFASFSPDGAIAAVFSLGGNLDIIRCDDGVRVGGAVLRPAAAVAAFHPDGKAIAIGDVAGGVHAFDISAGGVS